MNNLRCWLLISFVTFSVQACSPLGDPVNVAVSDNHFYNPDRSDILFCRMGNWFELGESSLNANVESFEVFNRLIAKDKDRIYFQSNPVRPSSIDLSSFYAKDNPDMYQIGFDKNHVYGFHMSRNWGEDAEVTLIKRAAPNRYIQMRYEWG